MFPPLFIIHYFIVTLRILNSDCQYTGVTGITSGIRPNVFNLRGVFGTRRLPYVDVEQLSLALPLISPIQTATEFLLF